MTVTHTWLVRLGCKWRCREDCMNNWRSAPLHSFQLFVFRHLFEERKIVDGMDGIFSYGLKHMGSTCRICWRKLIKHLQVKIWLLEATKELGIKAFLIFIGLKIFSKQIKKQIESSTIDSQIKSKKKKQKQQIQSVEEKDAIEERKPEKNKEELKEKRKKKIQMTIFA